MACLPIPFRDELVFSVIARYGVYSLSLSSKLLLDDVFRSKTVVASVALPNHLQQIAAHYQHNTQLTAEKLLRKHTLYPLYSPFVHPDIAKRAKSNMLFGCESSAELQLGKAASIVKSPLFLKYCPQCLAMQLDVHKEWYWHRLWQTPGVMSCPHHGALLNSKVYVHSNQKHAFSPLNPLNVQTAIAQRASKNHQRLSKHVQTLLNAPEVYIHPKQWSSFYRTVAHTLGLHRGKHIDHQGLSCLLNTYWGKPFLTQLGLNIDNDVESNWLRTLFRKHRKSFSYLQHLLVWQACFDEHLDPIALLNDVAKGVYVEDLSRQTALPTQLIDQDKREQWQQAVIDFGVKGARKNGFSGLYIWLYRYDRDWLLSFNQSYTQQRTKRLDKVDWHKRDLIYVKQFIKLRNAIELNLQAPRLTKNWYFLQSNISLSQIKHLKKLPLCKLFLNKFCETIEEYQCRRIAVACIFCDQHHQNYRHWHIQRLARLSKDRIRPLTAELLGCVVSNVSSG